MISMKSSENLWRVMHAGNISEPDAVRSVMQPPSTPGAHVLSASRPTTSISSLTARENLRLERRVDTASAPTLQLQGVVARPNIGPNDMDFKRVLERLNRIAVQGGTGARKMVLTEEKAADILLDENESLYLRIPTQNQPCPLQLILKRSKGRLISYTSKTIAEPMDGLCDSTFKGDVIRVSDSGPKFRLKSVFVTIHALEDAIVSLKVTFGRSKPVLKLTPNQIPEDSDWMTLFASSVTSRVTKSRIDRNFIEENAQVRILSPNTQEILVRREALKSRQAEVIKRFRQNLTLKRTKALNVINKREIQRQERVKLQREAEAKAERDKFNQKWLTLVAYSAFVEEIQVKMQERKAEMAAEDLRHKTASKIQRRFRLLVGSHVPTLALARCQHALRLLVKLVGPFTAMKTASSVTHCLRLATKNASIKKRFLLFHNSSNAHIVLSLQAYWRLAITAKKSHFDRLQQAWNQSFSQFIDSLGKKKQSRKGKRGKEMNSSRYFAISPSVRQQVLMQYFSEQQKLHREAVRKFLLDRKVGIAGLPPMFSMNTDEEILKTLIEKAADIAEQFAAGN